MLKLIAIADLKPGMYIIDVTNTWSKRFAVPKKMYVLDNSIIERLTQGGFREVFIDTSKTRQIKHPLKAVTPAQKENEKLRKLITQAFAIRIEVQQVISEIMSDAGSGKKIALDKARQAVKDVTEFTMDNPFLLAGLVLMRRKSRYLFEHALCSSVLMVAFTKAHGLDSSIQQEYGLGAMLHDIGMIKVSTAILNKRGDLTADDIEQLRRHVAYGYNMLKELDNMPESVLKMASQHHERLDGSGYPLGLQGDQISLAGQMAAIIDVYNAATSDKGYRKGIAPAKAIAELMLKSSSAFNRDLVNTFIRAVGIYPFGTLVKLSSGLVGIVLQVEQDDLLHPVVRIIYNPVNGGMVTPYNMNLKEYKNDQQFKIKGIVEKDQLFLQDEDIDKILGIN